MAKRKHPGNRRQRDFRVVARGVRRVNPDLSRILKTTLDHHLTGSQAATEIDVAPPGQPDAPGEEGQDVPA